MKKRVLFQFLGAGFLIGISIKYLLECYTNIFNTFECSNFYMTWYMPLLDFIPVLIIGFVFLFNLIIVNLKKGDVANV